LADGASGINIHKGGSGQLLLGQEQILDGIALTYKPVLLILPTSKKQYLVKMAFGAAAAQIALDDENFLSLHRRPRQRGDIIP
jgi:hypothetical protein